MPLYEIERKFVYNARRYPVFCQNKGIQPFWSLIFWHTETIQDEYSNFCNHLSGNGIYIRRRNRRWEAKKRRAGDFIRSSFYETKDVNEIASMACKYTQLGFSVATPGDNFGLKSICRYVTTRETWRVDTEFEVMLDSTDFGHRVGEVELEAKDEATAIRKIDSFLQRYEWFFCSKAEPKGKMTAYFEKFGYPGKGLGRKVKCP